MAGENTYKESDGLSVQVTLSYTTGARRVAYVEGWLGITHESGDSGDVVAMSIDEREYQLTLPASFAGAKGDDVYIDVSAVTGHIPNDAGYYKTSGSNRRRIFKLTSAQDANNVAYAKMVSQ